MNVLRIQFAILNHFSNQVTFSSTLSLEPQKLPNPISSNPNPNSPKNLPFQVTLSALLAVASAAPNAPAPYAAPHPAPYHEEPVLPPVYNYEYGVQDGYSGAVFSHAENRDNYDTAGEYRVNLPDGRVQIVTYKADANGYTADIKYEGEAHYPEDKEYKPAHPAPYKPAPAPAYKPAPVVHKPVVHKPAPAPYHPAPAYKPAPKVYHPAPAPYHPAPYHG